MSEEQRVDRAEQRAAASGGAGIPGSGDEPGGPGDSGLGDSDLGAQTAQAATPQEGGGEGESFAANVRRLVAEGRLSPEDADQLLGGEAQERYTPQQETRPERVPSFVRGPVQDPAQGGGPRLLELDVSGYALSVVHDPSLHAPTLSAHPEGQLELSGRGDRWSLRPRGQRLSGLRAVLSVPSLPPEVQAGVRGGSLTLPDGAYALRAEVQGGSLRAGGLGALRAEVMGGSVSTEMVVGALQVEVAGGSLRTAGRMLRASVSGGSLEWSGELSAGQHRLEVNGGSATLHLSPASSLQVSAEVTVGGFRADFPLEQDGSMFHKSYRGTLGAGAAELRCQVSAGQVRLERVTLP